MPEIVEPVRASRGHKTTRVPLFVVEEDDGTETTYTVPEEVHPSVAWRYITRLRDGVDDMRAFALMLEDIIGAEAMDALDSEDIDPDVYEFVMDVVEKKALAAQEKVAGKSRNGRRRSRG